MDQSHAVRRRVALGAELAQVAQRYPDYAVRIVADEGYGGKRAQGRFSIIASSSGGHPGW